MLKWAYRVLEQGIDDDRAAVWKHDNDDDGEDAAGSRMAHLLDMRNETGVLGTFYIEEMVESMLIILTERTLFEKVVCSRWYGGVKLGPKRFAHITNVCRELLVSCHENDWK
jgi:putative IMPACT (imprinted ancient) family translation regulator